MIRKRTLTHAAAVPDEPLGGTPRRVRLTAAGVLVAGFAVVCLAGTILSAVWLSRLAARGTERRAQFEREAIETRGEMVALGRSSGGEGKRSVTYRYTAGGKAFSGRVMLQRRDWRKLEPGSEVAVRYLASDPGVSYLGRRGPGGVPPVLVPVVSLSFAFAAAVLVWCIRGQRRLLAEGRPAIARVLGAKRGRHGERVRFEFTVLSGAVRTGSHEIAGTASPPGSAIVILYDREKPGRTAPYPLSLVRLDRR